MTQNYAEQLYLRAIETEGWVLLIIGLKLAIFADF